MRIFFALLGFWNALFAFIPVQSLGKQYLAHRDTLYTRFCGESYFGPAEGLPALPPSRFFSRTENPTWDGQNLVRSGETSDGRFGIETATLKNNPSGKPGWAFSPPLWLPGKISLVGACGGQALVEYFSVPSPAPAVGSITKTKEADGNPSIAPNLDLKPAPVAKPESHLRTLWLIDLVQGQQKKIMELKVDSNAICASAVVDDKAYLFYGSGVVMVFSFFEGSLTTPIQDFWKDEGWTLCRKTGEIENKGIDGPAFLDPDGKILIPVRPLLVLDAKDASTAWSKMPDSQRNKLINEGEYPFDESKGHGWKSKAGFLAFDPDTKKAAALDRDKFSSLVEDVDVNFIKTEFIPSIESGQVFASNGLIIQTLEAAIKAGELYREKLKEREQKAKTRATSKD